MLQAYVERNSEVRIRRQVELHLVGAHLCLTQWIPGHRAPRWWVAWLGHEPPHVCIRGVLWGREFRVRAALWPAAE